MCYQQPSVPLYCSRGARKEWRGFTARIGCVGGGLLRVGEVNEGWMGQTRDGCDRQRMGWADEVMGGANEEWVGQMR